MLNRVRLISVVHPILAKLSLLALAAVLATSMLALTSTAPAHARPLGVCDVGRWSEAAWNGDSWTDPNTGVGISASVTMYGLYDVNTGAPCYYYYATTHITNAPYGAGGSGGQGGLVGVQAYYCLGAASSPFTIYGGGPYGSTSDGTSPVAHANCTYSQAYTSITLSDGFARTVYTPLAS